MDASLRTLQVVLRPSILLHRELEVAAASQILRALSALLLHSSTGPDITAFVANADNFRHIYELPPARHVDAVLSFSASLFRASVFESSLLLHVIRYAGPIVVCRLLIDM